MFLHHFLGFSTFKIFHTWSSYFDSKVKIYNTLCWYSGKDTGLPPRRPQIEFHSHQAFLQKALTRKKFKNLAKIDLKLIWITLEKPYWQSLLWQRYPFWIFDNCFKTAQNLAYHVIKVEEDTSDLLPNMCNSGISLGNELLNNWHLLQVFLKISSEMMFWFS